jgi:hypothetical protein
MAQVAHRLRSLCSKRYARTDGRMAHPHTQPRPRRDFTWRFVVTDVQLPIIGVDLLANFNLLVDCRNNRILEGLTIRSNTPSE